MFNSLVNMPNNTCPEDATSAAYATVFKMQNILTFHTDSLRPEDDIQIDLLSIFEPLFILEIKDSDLLQRFISSLDVTKCYFARTGTVGGAGHFQILRYQPNGWEIYTTETNRRLVTSGDGILLEDAKHDLYLSSMTAKWGSADGNRQIRFVEASPENIIKAANYISKFRKTEGEDFIRNIEASQYAHQHTDFNIELGYYQFQPAKQSTIHKNHLQAILSTYKTTSQFLNVIIRILSLGFFSHQSGTICALKSLLNMDKTEFTPKNIIHAINSPSNHDWQKTRRASFFNRAEESNYSDTDRILSEIKRSFNINQ